MLTSLWQLDPQDSLEILIAYYHQMSTGEGRSEALRYVQLQRLDSVATAHPYYWASFVVFGDIAPLTTDTE